MLSTLDLAQRIIIGSVLGGAIGLERTAHRRPAGLRTHLLVALASTTFMVVSAQFVYYQRYAHGDLVEVDTSRIAASVVSGIGFLAGGAILRSGLTVQGLTTAAGLWLVSAIGLCAGAGMYVESVLVTALGIVALTLLRSFEKREPSTIRRRVALILLDEPGLFDGLVTAVEKNLGGVISRVDYKKRLQHNPKLAVKFDVRLDSKVTIDALVEALANQKGVQRVHIFAPDS